jgi:CRP-like cAMP-binding protein
MVVRKPTEEDLAELVQALHTARHRIPLDEEQIKALAARALIREVMRGEIVMEQGAEPDALYFVISGQLSAVDISSAEKRALSYHAAKTFVGEQGMIYGRPRAARVDVISDAKLAFWDRATFEWLLGQNGQVRPFFEELYQHRERRSRQPFAGRQPDEVTIVHARKHPLMLFNALTLPAVLLLLSLGLIILLSQLQELPTILIGVTAGFTIMIPVLWGAYNFIDWRDDEYIVTSKRVIHIERYVFYGEERDEAPLVRIQDVTVHASNIWERLLNYYDVTIQTAGAGKIVFAGITDAEQVKETIFEERAKAQERREAADIGNIRKALAQRTGRQIPELDRPVDVLPATTGAFARNKTRQLPRLLDYLWPRMSVVQDDTITWRKHWFVWLAKTWPALLLTVTLSSLAILALLSLPPFTALNQGTWIAAAILGFGAFAAYTWYIYLYDDWHKDVYIVTHDRIIDVESSSFRLRGEQRREGTFEVVQNITYVIPSFFHRLLNMGNVTIETAGTAETFTFRSIFNPSAVQQEIFNRMVAYQEEQRQKQRIREDLRTAEWFGQYHNIHLEGDHTTTQN